MRLGVLLEMVLAAEPLATTVHRARERLDAAVDPLVARQLLVSREAFAAAGLGAGERPLPGVNSRVTGQLAVVGKSRAAYRATKTFWPLGVLGLLSISIVTVAAA